MLDTDAWSVYAGEYADYAIGGPSVELLLNSYNKKYNQNYVAQAPSSTGYMLGSNSSTDYWIKLSKSDDTLYTIDSPDADAYWLASPSANNSSSVFMSDYDGTVAYYSYNTDAGFRPVVCLDSGARLVKNSDGTYTIVGIF